MSKAKKQQTTAAKEIEFVLKSKAQWSPILHPSARHHVKAARPQTSASHGVQ